MSDHHVALVLLEASALARHKKRSMRRNYPEVSGGRDDRRHHLPSEYDPRRGTSDSTGIPREPSAHSYRRERSDHEERRHHRERSRSRSPSPQPDRRRGEESTKDEIEAARRARMARLRAENDEEERRMAMSENPSKAILDTTQQSGVVDAAELEGLDEEEQMRRLLGFEGFGSTKNTKVEDNHKSSARGVAAKNKARKYRQYMNRKNGFNRPLDKMD